MKFSAVILAGGKSSRMGCDKAFVEFNGCTLLDRQIDTLVAAGAEDVLISGRPEVDYSAFACRVVIDRFSGVGPLAGIHAALESIKNPLLLVLAVDLPQMSAMFLRSLINTSKGSGVIPRVGAQIEPLAALYPKTSAALIETMLEQKRFAAHQFAEACIRENLGRFENVSRDFARLFKNLNSPADLMADSVLM